MFKLNKIEFSEFAQLVDLSRYSLIEMKQLIKDLNLNEQIEGQINFVTWANEYYEFIIEYDLNGCYRRINSEKWKDPKKDMITRLINAIK